MNLAADVDDTESGRIGEAIVEHALSIDGLGVLPGGEYPSWSTRRRPS